MTQPPAGAANQSFAGIKPSNALGAAGGVAAEHGFQINVILEVGGKTVSTPSEVRKSLADAHSDGKHTILFRVNSDDGMKFVAIPLGNA